MIKLTKTQEIALISLLAAFNIASRIFLQGFPNIKPVTSIIMISVFIFNLAFAIKLSIVTTIVSNLFLGMGIWTFFQILAWICIALLTQIVVDVCAKYHRKPNLIGMSIFAFFMGYVFGFIVSLDKLMIGGPTLFWTYYVSGLVFDTFHAVGNFFFYLLCAPILYQVFVKQSKHMSDKNKCKNAND
ncbi:MAG: hypothetical protein EOM50_04355 [Erysipelotrichia bacterium]|nr:hypothetical protein [Erysipelotrichia bacterium]NCC54455.1 hypothetical protein [Erysipelotrichia bacterium]